MKEGFILRDQAKAHFIPMTVVDWIDIFSRKIYRDTVVDSLNYCIENKGMILYGSRRGRETPTERGNRLLLEYKYGPTSITKDVILTQFIERDLFNPDITSINQIQWRLKDTGFTKETLYYWLSNDVECRTAIENLGATKVNELLGRSDLTDDIPDLISNAVIDYLNNTSNYNKIFK